MLGTAGNEAIMTDLSATSVIAMRQATKDVFYTTVNSSIYDNYQPGTLPGWQRNTYIVDGVLIALVAVGEILVIRSYRKSKKTPKVSVE